jgi:hypothetical protein
MFTELTVTLAIAESSRLRISQLECMYDTVY